MGLKANLSKIGIALLFWWCIDLHKVTFSSLPTLWSPAPRKSRREATFLTCWSSWGRRESACNLRSSGCFYTPIFSGDFVFSLIALHLLSVKKLAFLPQLLYFSKTSFFFGRWVDEIHATLCRHISDTDRVLEFSFQTTCLNESPTSFSHVDHISRTHCKCASSSDLLTFWVQTPTDALPDFHSINDWATRRFHARSIEIWPETRKYPHKSRNLGTSLLLIPVQPDWEQCSVIS